MTNSLLLSPIFNGLEGNKICLEGYKKVVEGNKIQYDPSNCFLEGNTFRLEGYKKLLEGNKNQDDASNHFLKGNTFRLEGNKKVLEGNKNQDDPSNRFLEGNTFCLYGYKIEQKRCFFQLDSISGDNYRLSDSEKAYKKKVALLRG